MKKLGHKDDRSHTNSLYATLRLYIESCTLIMRFKTLKQDVSNTLVLSSLVLSFKGSYDESVYYFAIVQNELKKPLKSLLL